MINILIFPSGSLVAQEIYDSLKYIRNIKIYGTDFDYSNFSSFYFENYIAGCPFIKQELETFEFLREIVIKYDIKYIFPAFDSVILFLKKFENILKVKVIAPDEDIIEICNSKLLTYKILKDFVNIPKIYSKDEKNIQFPLYSKPIIGYGTRNHKIIDNEVTLNDVDEENNLILEYLPGKEYTIDCFSNYESELLYCQGRERIKTVNGMSVLSKTVNLDNIEQMGKIISEKLKMKGTWFFQVKYDISNKLKLLEVACRVSGAMCVNRVRGINFSYLSILNSEKINTKPILFNDIDVTCHKVYTNKYKHNIHYDAVYCDLDDTLIIHDKVNIQLISFLYLCLNKNVSIFLITRNESPKSVLENFKIDIFNEIFQLNKNKDENNIYINKKSEIINANNSSLNIKSSIFIDDSFEEKYDVKNSCNIFCFSPSDIELLLN